jgi:hypothetical protein
MGTADIEALTDGDFPLRRPEKHNEHRGSDGPSFKSRREAKDPVDRHIGSAPPWLRHPR